MPELEQIDNRELTINFGSQISATHVVLRLVLELGSKGLTCCA